MPEASISPVRDHATPTHDDLIDLIARASDDEHGLARALLCAAAALKNDASEGGLTGAQADIVRGWKRRLLLAARDRVRRVAQLANLTTALGGTSRLARPTFPPPALEPAQAGDAPVPFSPSVIARLTAERAATRPGHTPTTLADPYAAIAAAIGALPAAGLVAGAAGAQVTERTLDLGGTLVAVTDHASALAALGTLTATGNAKTGDEHTGSDAGATIEAEYAAALAEAQMAGAPFEPARPVAVNPTLRSEGDAAGAGDARIVAPSTRAVAALFVDAYDTFLLVLRQTLAPASTGAPDAGRDALGRIAARLLDAVIRPLGEALARMPLDGTSPQGRCAGPPFGDVVGDDAPLPAAAALAEIDARLWRLATTATTLCAAPATPGLPAEVQHDAPLLRQVRAAGPAARAPLRAHVARPPRARGGVAG